MSFTIHTNFPPLCSQSIKDVACVGNFIRRLIQFQIRIAAEEDEIKKKYWNILKTKYLINEQILNDPTWKRKLRIIKERGTNVQMPQSKVGQIKQRYRTH